MMSTVYGPYAHALSAEPKKNLSGFVETFNPLAFLKDGDVVTQHVIIWRGIDMESQRSKTREESWINFEEIEDILRHCNKKELLEIKLLIQIQLARTEAIE